MKRLKKILKWTGIVMGGLAAIGLVANAWFTWTTDRRLEAQLAAIRAAGEPLKLSDLARKPIPPEQNAATYLRQAKADIEAIDAAVWVGDWWKGGKWYPLPPAGQKLVKAAFDAHPRVMPLLEQAAACSDYDDYDAQVDYMLPLTELEDRLLRVAQQHRGYARLLHLRAYLLAAEGKPDEAARTALVLMRLASHLERDFFLIGMLVEITLRSLAIDAANAALQAGPVSREVHDALDAELARLELMGDFRRAIVGERVYGMAKIAQFPGRNFWLGARGYWNRQESQYLDKMQIFLSLFHEPINYHRAVQTIDNASANGGVLVVLSTPALKAALTAAVQSQAMVRSLRVLNALQTHVPPASDKISKLGDLGLPPETTIDPFNGAPLHVKRLPGGWLVYSVGRNLQDDGGDWEHYLDIGVGPPRPAAKPAGK